MKKNVGVCTNLAEVKIHTFNAKFTTAQCSRQCEHTVGCREFLLLADINDAEENLDETGGCVLLRRGCDHKDGTQFHLYQLDGVKGG